MLVRSLFGVPSEALRSFGVFTEQRPNKGDELLYLK